MILKKSSKRLGLIFIMLLFSLILLACDKTIKVTSIELSREEVELEVGDTVTITATVLPENATDKTVEWSSDKPEVATVDNGVIEAVGAGEATITASCGSVSKTVKVVVTEPEPEPTSFTVTFISNGGTVIEPIVVNANEKVTKPEDPTKRNVVFGGWYIDSDLTTLFDFEKPITADITLYAKWLETFDVVFNAEGIDYIEPIKVTEGELITEPNLKRPGFVISGWFLDPAFTEEYDLNEPVTQELILYGKWQEVFNYTIRYELNGGENHPDNNITDYHIFDLPIALYEPTREGYTFLGWYANEYFTEGPFDKIDFGRNYTLFAKWVPNEKVNTYANPDLADLEKGEVVVYNEIEFIVGKTAFASLADAVQASTLNVYVVGTFDEDVVISESGISLIGPNANIDPNKDERIEEAVLKGKITLTAGVENITFNGLAFTDAGRITGTQAKKVDFIYNYVYDTVEAKTPWQETAGYTSGFFAFANESNGQLQDFTFKYNKFDKVSDVNINFSRVTNVLVANNTFTNFDRDAIRFDNGGFNDGDLIFRNNIFSNDTLGGYNGIYFRIYGGDQVIPTLIQITNNTFKNIGQTNLQIYSGAISMRNYQEKLTEIEISYNTFETCANYIHIRNNATKFNHQNYPWEAAVNYNKFIGIPTTYYHKNRTGSDKEETNPAKMNFDHNLFLDNDGKVITDLTPYQDKLLDIASCENNYQAIADYEKAYDDHFADIPTEIAIANPIEKLVHLLEHKIELNLTPSDANDDVYYLSSDENVATVSSDGVIKAVAPGKVTITVVSNLNEDVLTRMDFEVVNKERIEVRYEGPGALLVDQNLQLTATLHHVDETEIEWTTSDADIATVDSNGLVVAKAPGTVTITATVKGTDVKAEVGVTVYGNEITDEFLIYLISVNTGVVDTREIYYIGSDDGSGDFLNRFYTSVSKYYFGDYEITENWLQEGASNWNGPNRKIKVELICIHDTAGSGAGSTAKANSGWCTNPGNTASSWHYTVGNDGVFQQIEDDVRAWHAGDGSREFELLDTGVKAEGDGKPIIAINKKGYYTINGIQSNIKAPEIAQIAQLGIYTTIGENGNYWMNRTWFSDSYRLISNHGGNNNSIGIETAVNNRSDIYFTWHLTAKLVSRLLVKHELGLDRVLYHNNFSGKPCPRTMMTADLVPVFQELVAAEYEVQSKYSDYEVEFISHNPDIVDNTGRVIGRPLETTSVSYTIKVTKGGTSQEITLNALIPGQYNW